MYVRELIGDMAAELREDKDTLTLLQGEDYITLTREQTLHLVSFLDSHKFISGKE